MCLLRYRHRVMVWCMTTRHGLCTISKNFNKNSEKKYVENIKKSIQTHPNIGKKKWQLQQQPNMRILSCQSSLTGFMATTTTTTRNENKLNASISNFYALFFVFRSYFLWAKKNEFFYGVRKLSKVTHWKSSSIMLQSKTKFRISLQWRDKFASETHHH